MRENHAVHDLRLPVVDVVSVSKCCKMLQAIVLFDKIN